MGRFKAAGEVWLDFAEGRVPLGDASSGAKYFCFPFDVVSGDLGNEGVAERDRSWDLVLADGGLLSKI